MDRRKATWSNYALCSLSILTVLVPIFVPYGILIVLLSVPIICKQILVRLIFTGPRRRSLPFEDKNWEKIHADNNGIDIFAFIDYNEKNSDLVVFIHGWQSSSEKFTERMQIFRDKGFHTMAIDMRGHGIAPSTMEWTAGKVINDIKIILEKVNQNLVNRVHFYGHSLGGFICLGMQNNRHDGWWKKKFGTLILESPMVAYSKILEQMSIRISFLLPLLKKWAVIGFNKIHPEIGNIQWKDIDIPYWGLPSAPVLLLQAKNDSRLGRFHYDLLLEQDLEIDHYLIDTLTHTRNRVNEERDTIIRKWIDERLL